VLEHCREGESTVGTTFFGSFPPEHIPKATKDVNVPLFIHSSNFCKFSKEFLELLEATARM